MHARFPSEITACDTSVTISVDFTNVTPATEWAKAGVLVNHGTGEPEQRDIPENHNLPDGSGTWTIVLAPTDLSDATSIFVTVQLYSHDVSGIYINIDEAFDSIDVNPDCGIPDPTSTLAPQPTVPAGATPVVTAPPVTDPGGTVANPGGGKAAVTSLPNTGTGNGTSSIAPILLLVAAIAIIAVAGAMRVGAGARRR
ncbi:MAG TPA: hypothetical protein VFQ54_00645 [Thermomicrobiales bacterium]|nr:hypothetical protein [Thermomicrobiales bacterium]